MLLLGYYADDVIFCVCFYLALGQCFLVHPTMYDFLLFGMWLLTGLCTSLSSRTLLIWLHLGYGYSQVYTGLCANLSSGIRHELAHVPPCMQLGQFNYIRSISHWKYSMPFYRHALLAYPNTMNSTAMQFSLYLSVNYFLLAGTSTFL